MLSNLSVKNTYRSDIQKQRKFVRKMLGATKSHCKGMDVYKMIKPTKYVGVYEGSLSLIDINDWFKQFCYDQSRQYQRKIYNIPDYNERIKAEQNIWSFGVADNIEQVIDLYNKNENGYFSGNHIILFQNVVKGYNGGWRWHKWGPYIGT